VLPLVRSVLAVPGLALRRNWLRVQSRERNLPALAAALEELCEAAEASEPSAREALMALVALLVCDAETPWVEALRKLAHETHHHSLMRLLRTYSLRPSLTAADDSNPALGHELTVGERRSLARRPHRGKIDRLLRDPHPLVLRQLLGNPTLTENDVVALAAQRPAREAALRTLAEFPDWIVRHRVRMTIVSNPLSPSGIAVPLTALATRPELLEIADNPALHLVLRVVAREILERRPPLGPADSLTLQ
jgi:hypothetical protein